MLLLRALLAVGASWFGLQIIIFCFPQNAFSDWILWTLQGLISVYLFFFFAIFAIAMAALAKLMR